MSHFRTLDLAVDFYHQVEALKLRQPLRDQLQRAALSISLNLAEGNGKPTHRDRLKFFHIAMGSTRECQTILKILKLDDELEIVKRLDQVAASLYRLIQNAR